MLWIKTTRRFTFTKYLVEADTAEDAEGADGTYLGVVDGPDDAIESVAGPFADEDQALADVEAYTEWT